MDGLLFWIGFSIGVVITTYLGIKYVFPDINYPWMV